MSNIIPINSELVIAQELPIKKIENNFGQIEGLPKNPRFIRDHKYEKLVKSIQDDPEMLLLRELVVYPLNNKYVVIMGNMRLRACTELGYKTMPCKILHSGTPLEKLKAYTIKDNVSYGEHNWDLIANEWDVEQLKEWAVDLPVNTVEIGSDSNSDDDYGDKNKEVNLDDYEEKMEFKLKLTSDEFFDIQERLSVVKAKQNVNTNEEAIFELLSFYERNA